MPRGSSGAEPSDDIGWKFADPVPNDRHKLYCKLCGRLVTGGITRLKQHLAHLTGQIKPCPNVSTEIREEMMRHLRGQKEKQIDKKKQREELAAQIRASQRQYGDDDDADDDEYGRGEGITISSDDDDPAMTMARRESMREYREQDERQRFAARSRRYDAGSSSRTAGGAMPKLGRRSASVRESSSQQQWLNPNAPEARLAAMDPMLHRGKEKQTKLPTKVMKTLRTRLGGAVSQFLIYGRHSANAVLNPWFKPMLDVAREVGPNVELPTPYEVTEVYLPREYELIKKWIESQKPVWAERGVTVMCDGWTGPTRKHIMNFLVYSNRGTIFHKSIDATDVPSRTSEYYLSILDKVIDEIGEQYVVQVVTDNEAALKLAGKKLMEKRPHLYWTACAAHCIDLILEDIGKKSSVAKVLDDAREITSFIYQYNWLVNLMKKFTDGRELLRPAITRFATNFITLESLVRQKGGLQEMFHCSEWRNSKWGKDKYGKGTVVQKKVMDKDFWVKATEILKVQEPLVKVLRLVDGDEKPTMGYIYEAMDRAKLAIRNDCRYYRDYWKIIDKRWNFQLHHDLHGAGYFLNPIFQYGENFSDDNREAMTGLKEVIQRLEPNIDNQIRAINQILMYRDKEDSFGTVIAQRAVHHTNPAEWWIHYGTSAPELQRIAVKVLSQTTSASNCERNWSTFSLIHTKTRNRLKYMKVNKLVYVYYNMRLKIRHSTRRSQKEIEDHFNPINLDYIFDEDDPLAPWLQEREPPTLDGQDNSDWLDDDDDSHTNTTSQAPTEQRSPSAGGSGGGGGLSPISSSHTDTNSPPDGGNAGGTQLGAGGETSEHRGSSPYLGEHGMHGFHDDEEIGDDAHLIRYRRRGRRLSGETRDRGSYDDHPVMHQFGELGFQGQHDYYPPQEQMPYPISQGPEALYYGDPPLYHQPPLPSPPTYHQPPIAYDAVSGLFGPSIPYGYTYMPSESSSSVNTMDTTSRASRYYQRQQRRPGYDDDDDNEEPRNSFWI